MFCKHCGRVYIDVEQMQAILDWGYCLSCDHVEAEAKEAEMAA